MTIFTRRVVVDVGVIPGPQFNGSTHCVLKWPLAGAAATSLVLALVAGLAANIVGTVAATFCSVIGKTFLRDPQKLILKR